MKLGISFSFQAHRALGEPYDKAYREGLELAAEASRLGIDSIWASERMRAYIFIALSRL